ncbi:MAG: hypothetical protein A2508_10535 [Candidatus Lambdaproteobacteria bacterium RIFOXYD12_FULL_49_8]|uniref:Molybdopterin synthase sulfur carrier subunit n=1 Tax=Candidatus Lambdaproteobacteria bacterium RIFOXYD2_FULL_50_16 TaxID=1817772 RepID=A0A1F6GER6_9PROT|nr:MAG: hypothetical protein A2527_03340 [Candidatus Lambdaproteobacteria bacterium RIFOXYD2_FULL_50_16]OGG97866.1 MAG: hypothetical protein A2508_10535 [Candidatus Lambdaproteobacteria bacterium RIFOXYD12_FULL_49_8]
MQVRLLLFAGLKELVGKEVLGLELKPGARVQDALDQLLKEHPAASPLRSSLRAAIDLEYAELDAVLSEGVELALIPPVGGG